MKRVYSSDGTKSCPVIAYLIISAFVLPAFMVYAFFDTLQREIRSAFWYAWQDMCGEFESFLQYWRDRR